MQSSILTKADWAEIDPPERRRPGRFDDVNLELVPLLRGDVSAATEAIVPENDVPPEYAAVLDRDPVAERQTAFKVLMIIVALAGLVLLLGK
jgi:hypothetical protein